MVEENNSELLINKPVNYIDGSVGVEITRFILDHGRRPTSEEIATIRKSAKDAMLEYLELGEQLDKQDEAIPAEYVLKD